MGKSSFLSFLRSLQMNKVEMPISTEIVRHVHAKKQKGKRKKKNLILVSGKHVMS